MKVVGIDIGGTFTDVVLADHEAHTVHTGKALTTPDAPADGVVAAFDLALASAGLGSDAIDRCVHATTLATNVILERAGAAVAYVATAGFGDLLVIGHDRRGDADKYNLRYTKQPPLVPRRRTLEIAERVGARGEVVTPLDDDEARAALHDLFEREQVDAVAVCFLHAHANDVHEQRVAAIARELRPDLFVVCSSDVWPEYRELPRANTAVVSAYVGPTVSRYVERLEARLAEHGLRCGLQIMKSNGGTTSAAAVAQRPIQLVESGPAAGVIAAAHVGHTCGIADLISFDMGGTTAKAGLVQGGEPTITTDFAVGGYASAGLKRIATGYQVKLPVIDLAEVGAGGGSIARVDPGGIVRVGPDSAGSQPGPACYARGGARPTVTDANLVLGYLNADYFLGGTMRIDPDRAWRAIEEHIATPLGIDVVEAAAGIHEIANANMAAAIRVVTIERGIDPRDFALVATGGAGPAHAVRLAETFDVGTVIVPAEAGVGSAVGLVVSDVVVDLVRTHIVDQDRLDAGAIASWFDDLEQRARAEVEAEGFAADAVRIERTIDVRFRFQAHELGVPLADGPVDDPALVAAAQGFRDLYARLYGVRPGDPVEYVNYRVRAIGAVPTPDWGTDDVADAPAEVHGRRPVHFAETKGFTDTPVYRRRSLRPGHTLSGPAILEDPSTSIVVPPGHTVTVDRWRNLRIT